MDQEKNILSEHTKDMTLDQTEELRQKTESMTDEERKAFRNSFNPDEMGFFGEEG